ncbi:MAG: hypothetical protein ACO273_09485 [Burkholderiales bacterium]
MIQRGVRLLLVVDADRRVHGLVTANDVLGEKPVKTAVQQGVHRSEVQVRDILTPRDALEALDIRDVEAATVGHIVSTLKAAGRVFAASFRRRRLRGSWASPLPSKRLPALLPILRPVSGIDHVLSWSIRRRLLTLRRAWTYTSFTD